jgi:phytoene dehydrogenase-like protein
VPTNSYDVVVLGDELAGLIAATLCARRGLRALIIESGERPARYQLGPYRLPIEALPIVGLSSPAVRRVLDELHFQHLLKRKLRTPSPSYQLVGPDVRIAVDADDAVLGRELERELPGGAEAAERYLAASQQAHELAALIDPVFSMDIAVPPTGFWERREIGRSADRLLADAEAWGSTLESDLARAFFGMPAVFGAGVEPAGIGPVTRARAFTEWRAGISRLPGDWEALRAVFLDKFTSHNGEVRAVEPQALSTSWGKVTGLVLDGGEELGAGHLVAALPAAELAALCDGKLARRVIEVADTTEVAACRYTLNLVLDGVGVPEGMGAHVLLVGDPAAPLSGDNALAIFIDQPDGEARVAITVQAICPVPPGGPGPALEDALASLRVGVRERLESVMPFHADHVRVAHSPNESSPAEGDGGEIERARIAAPRPLWRPVAEPLLGVAGLSYQLGIKQLTLASSQILPGLGLEGEMATGWCAAKIVCESSGKKKDYIKDDLLNAR